MRKFWTKEEKDELKHFAFASDHENNEEMFEYVSTMMLENGYTRSPSQVKSMYYKVFKG